MSLEISVVVCTHNRADYLRCALESLVNQTLPSDRYEIIVVDNASQDDTAQVVRGFRSVENLNYLYEPALGLSCARNTGWHAAQGRWVAFLDDDAEACPEWLEKIVQTFKTFQPTPAAIGGRIQVAWDAPKPAWLSDQMLSVLSIYHYSDTPVILRPDQWLSACNIAYQRDLLEKTGGFREDLGRKGQLLRSGEERDIQNQFDQWGEISVYQPEISVAHHIPASRLTHTWFRNHAYWTGRSAAIILNVEQHPSLIHRIWLVLQKITWAAPRSLLMLSSRDSAARFRRQCQVVESLGFVAGLWGTQYA